MSTWYTREMEFGVDEEAEISYLCAFYSSVSIIESWHEGLPEWAKERFAEIQKQEAAKAAPNQNQNKNKDMEVR